KYPSLVLSSFEWHERSAAESLLRAYAEQGGQVLVDLTGAPNDPLAREPRLFDVYGENVQFYTEPVRIIGQEISGTLLPFQIQPWQAIVPQGDLMDVVQFSYHEVTGTALGYLEFGQGKVWFIGQNIPYHTLLTKDPLGASILKTAFSLDTQATSISGTIPLQNYLADQSEYTFDYSLQAQEELLIPVAACDGTTVQVDGAPAVIHPLYNLISITAPAGTHHVEISSTPTGIFWTGAVISLTALIVGIVGLFYWKGIRT
ncbi:MAG: 6-pyruvoyl-tetrahydropterin synthase-related protein, partial [Chloroflexota bacterium]